MIPNDDRDRRLAEVLAEITDDRASDRGSNFESIVGRHPDLAEELRELWAAASIAEEFAGSSLSTETDVWPSIPTDPPGSHDRGSLGGYELIDEVGRGGMGVVHRARQSLLGRTVAIKRLLHGASSRPEDVARFQAEAESAGRLSHPHIVTVHDVGTDRGQPYLVMQFVEGTTLARRLADGPLRSGEAASILAPVCRAIQHAHERGVLHRDLKPSNILIDPEGRPLVVDFGLAKRIDLGPSAGLTESGAILGTPSYMAPEQASTSRGPVGPPADVYGLGAILYQMLTGRPPFQSASPLDTILLVLEQDPVPPRVLNPRADTDLEMITLKCLQKDPRLRYPTASDLADDLDAYLAGRPVSARSTSFRALAGRYLSETPHSALLENWGVLWMYHSVALLVLYGLTWGLMLRGVMARWPYFAIFTLGLGSWAALFWRLRRRRGPVTFVERQLAHVWGAGVIGLNLILDAEWLMGLPVMSLAPILCITNGMLFLIKGGLLSGEFYIHGALLFATLIPATLVPELAVPAFALVSAVCFFVTGLKYHRRYLRSQRPERASMPRT
ncbi:serine/threonine-protein kinase [Tundrisphaera lichenicola]|uniref:serine/threonine-protein kinase n=1 Tax=Tundrisphaera lichenicola TaxID=2029860 RepID=UPI003EBB16CA